MPAIVPMTVCHGAAQKLDVQKKFVNLELQKRRLVTTCLPIDVKLNYYFRIVTHALVPVTA